MDGGVRSATNADLARGYDAVLIVSVTTPGMNALPAVAQAMQRQLDGEVAALRQAGSLVELITPDEASAESFGLNLMDFSRRESVLEAGARQDSPRPSGCANSGSVRRPFRRADDCRLEASSAFRRRS
jgi:NTE family protein